MSSNRTLGRAVDPPLHREEAMLVAPVLAFDAYTWIIHSVLANPQSVNVVFVRGRAP